MNEPELDWDEEIEDHIANHGVSPEEAEEAILDPRQVPDVAYSTPTERRYAIVGATESGRILFVVFTMRRGRVRIVTAYSAPRKARLRYRRKRR
jgi:uncharacterized DUF497 family protein